MWMWSSFPVFGSAVLLCVMVMASYTFAVSLAAGASGRPRTLVAARYGAYGTVALIAAAVLLLAYAFQSHDFRLRYVAHHSDRSMSPWYLLTALWGGQDGSLLWWLFLLSAYTGACVKWLGKRYLELQPYIIATLMAVIVFFCVLMAFSANPFAESIGGPKADGEGLNPLLQNFYMIIHPPSLYIGFVGCTVPFAFCVAALVTGRLDSEWVVASRKWMLFAWLFLAIGNTLGMLWAYEELGWGGYWGWDPVENAAFLPLLTASAYVHSIMIQERRGMFKVWNVLLMCITFALTIFGTFLTRSGMIQSVHSFAQSSIGNYFVGFLALLVVVCTVLVAYRWPELRDYPASRGVRLGAVGGALFMLLVGTPGFLYLVKLGGFYIALAALWAGLAAYVGIELVFRRMTRGQVLHSRTPEFESIVSREFTFMLNNWGLLGAMLFVMIATTFPLISEGLWDEKITVGPPYYNAWMQPIGLAIFALMGIGSLFGWKKTSPELLRRAFLFPAVAFALAVIVHFAIGTRIGYPAVVWSEPIYGGRLGQALRVFNAYTPVIGISLCVFNAAVIFQEFFMLFRARRKGGTDKTPFALWLAGILPGFLYTMVTLPPQSRRRYGGYIVHLGLVLMFFGFTGHAWNIDKETSLTPGQAYYVSDYKLEYIGPRMEVDNTKRMIFADVKVSRGEQSLGVISPAKFFYKRMPEQPTTEVAMLHSARDDVYLVLGQVNPQTKLASLQIHINPLVVWIWFGCLVLIGGSVICLWPQLQPGESRVWAFARGSAAVATSVFIGFVIAATPVTAKAQSGTGSHAGTVRIESDQERDLFGSLRCMCGSCPRDLLSTCACDVAEATRQELRGKLRAGMTKDSIVAEYMKEFGTASLAIPPNTGALRLIYVAPLVAIGGAGVGLGVLVGKWRRRARERSAAGPAELGKGQRTARDDDYDKRLDDELKDLE